MAGILINGCETTGNNTDTAKDLARAAKLFG